MKLCKAKDCQKPGIGRYSPFCVAHRARYTRHGHEAQATITVAKLKPYCRLVRAWVARQPNQAALWDSFEALLAATVGNAAAALSDFRSVGCGPRHQYQANEDLVKLAAEIEPRRIIETVAAMAIMVEREGRAFQDDRAIHVQTARRVRALTDRHVGHYYDKGSERVKRKYREAPPKAAAYLGKVLMVNIGRIGVSISRLDVEQGQRMAAAKASMSAALEMAAAQYHPPNGLGAAQA